MAIPQYTSMILLPATNRVGGGSATRTRAPSDWYVLVPMGTRIVRTLALGFCFALVTLVVAVVPARAAAEVIRNLDVTFDVRADGTVGVTYVLDWDFGEEGRHGINFGIATRESWEPDPSQDVLYDIADIQVSSPTGAPSQFIWLDEDYGSDGALSLRVGDPSTTLDESRHTYEISYELTGALRTFDGLPELHWDITSDDYPNIENFRITVNAPEGVDRALCFVGEETCSADVAGGVGTFEGSDAQQHSIITIAAGMPAGSVANAEPNLEPRRITSRELTDYASHVTVTANGVAHVEQTMTYAVPERLDVHRLSATYRVYHRSPHDSGTDRLFTIEGIRTTVDGEPVLAEVDRSSPRERRQATRIEVDQETDSGTAVVVLSYSVRGAVDPDGHGGQAVFSWRPSDEDLEPLAPTTWTWEFPGEVSDFGCRRLRLDHLTDAGCTLPDVATVDGNTVTLALEGSDEQHFSTLNMFDVTFDGSSLTPGVALELDRSQDQINSRNQWLGFGSTALVTALVTLLFRYGSRFTLAKDTRYAGVAPGLVSTDKSVEESRRPRKAVVQFNPPDTDLATAGLLLDNRFHARHTAAVLTQLAVDRVVRIQSDPLSIRLGYAAPDNPLAHKMRAVVVEHEPIRTSNAAAIRALNEEIHHRQGGLGMDRRYIRKHSSFATPKFRAVVTIVGGVALLITGFVLFGNGIDAHNTLMSSIGLGLSLGAGLGIWQGMRGVRRVRQPLGPLGSALREQLMGFRTYIAKAEASQLEFEAGQDIYRRYLPWAVLFGLSKHWTKVCQELVASGRIPELDTSFVSGADATSFVASLHTFSTAASKQSPVVTEPLFPGFGDGGGDGWSGGSGGSSGFSGGGGGGSGGGGTSASSW